MIPEKGRRIVASVKTIKGTCNAGHRIGDEIPVSARNPGGMCGYLYHTAFPYIVMLQFGGGFPWDEPDAVELACPDLDNLLIVQLRRVE